MKTVTCRRCGKEFDIEGRYMFYCPECKKKVKQERKIAPKEPVKQVVRHKPERDLRTVNREARAHGMSYGQWVARNG